MTAKNKIIITALIFLLLAGLLFLFQSKLGESHFRLASLVGTLASLFALIIVWIQTVTLKSIAEKSREASTETRNKLIAFLSIVDITKMIKTVQEIQVYNRLRKFELSLLRMQELREGLLQIKNSSISSSFITPRHYSSLISTLSVDMGGIEKSIQYINEKEIDVSVLNNNLDTVLKAVSELSAKVRFQGE